MKRINWFFQDHTGKYVIGQSPNVPIYIMLGSAILQAILGASQVGMMIRTICIAALFLWSYLEIRYGESPFRRLLGVVGMTTFVMYAWMNA